MLTYLLAIVVALGSLTLYMIAFFFPELYRKYDLIWSGVALFYALMLWEYAERITGGILLGQGAGIALMGWFGWQTLAMRWAQTPIEQRTQVPKFEGSLGKVVQYQTEQLINYLQSAEFKSRLPGSFQEFSEQAKRLFNSAKEVTIALISTTAKSFQKAQKPDSGDVSEPD